MLLDAVPAGVAHFDLDGRYLHVNAALALAGAPGFADVAEPLIARVR